MFWTCCECGRRIGDDEYTSKGRTEHEHICMDCFWKQMDRPERAPEEVARMVTRQEQILVHLYGFVRRANEYEMPYGTIQNGIADSIGISRSQVSLEIKRLTEKGYVHCELRHAYREGCPDRKHRKCYRLDSAGIYLAKKLIASIEGVA